MDSNINFQTFLKDWFETPIGSALFEQERLLVEKELPRLFGYYLVQLGQPSQQSLLQTSRIKTKVVLDNHINDQVADLQVLADLDFLPFKDDSLDVVFMPHSLESVPDPYHLVRQVDRMLMAEGFLVVSGFNPYGCSLLRSYFSGARKGLKGANLLKMHRIIDWLNLLGYDIQVAQHGPISCFKQRSERLDSWFWLNVERFEGWLEHIGIHFGNIYIIVAKKRVVTPSPVGLDWKLANWLPVRKGQTVAACDLHKRKPRD